MTASLVRPTVNASTQTVLDNSTRATCSLHQTPSSSPLYSSQPSRRIAGDGSLDRTERAELLRKIAELETSLAAALDLRERSAPAHTRGYVPGISAGRDTSLSKGGSQARPATGGYYRSQPWDWVDSESDDLWQPAQSVFGSTPFQLLPSGSGRGGSPGRDRTCDDGRASCQPSSCSSTPMTSSSCVRQSQASTRVEEKATLEPKLACDLVNAESSRCAAPASATVSDASDPLHPSATSAEGLAAPASSNRVSPRAAAPMATPSALHSSCQPSWSSINHVETGDAPPPGWSQQILTHSAFEPTPSGEQVTGGLGGTLSASSVSHMKEGLREKVHTASKWLAELAAVSASVSGHPEETDRSRHTAYNVLRYLSSLSSLMVSLCSLPPRPEYVALFREVGTYVDLAAAASGSPAGSDIPSAAPDPAPTPQMDTELTVAGRAALLGELNDLCGLLSSKMHPELDLLSALKRAITAMRSELQPLFMSVAGVAPLQPAPSQQQLGIGLGTTLLSPDLRMSGNRGGGGGSDVFNPGASWGRSKPWRQRSDVPSLGPTASLARRPAWLVRSESLPGLPHPLPGMQPGRRSRGRGLAFGI